MRSRRRSWIRVLTGALLVVAAIVQAPAAPARSATLNVGPAQTYALPSQAIAAAAPGDTIEIDASGSYAGDTASFATSNLTLRGVNGRPLLTAPTVIPNQKGIWVVSGNNVVVENVEFASARLSVGLGSNGAGIRAQGGDLTVRGCYFHNNDNGILGPTAATAVVLVETSEFSTNGAGDGFSHNLYIGNIAALTFRFNYSHDASVGHLLKSRAAQNHVLSNRLTGENGTASYEVNLPNAGTSYVIGNLIQQNPGSQNSTIVDYGSEGITAGYADDLYVVNNSIVNDRGNGTFVRVTNATTPAVIRNNVFFGGGAVTNQAGAVVGNNLVGTDPLFANRPGFDYHLTASSPCVDQGIAPGTSAGGYPLLPAAEYLHPASSSARGTAGVVDIGAYEFIPPGSTATPTVSTPPSASPTRSLTASGSVVASPSPTAIGSPTATRTATASVTPSASRSATMSATRTAVPSASGTPTAPILTNTFSPTVVPASTPSATLSPAASASATPTATASRTVTRTPTYSPSISQTSTRTRTPTISPTVPAPASFTPTALATMPSSPAPSPVFGGPPRAAPNPVSLGAHETVTFGRLPPGETVRIYTVSGEHVTDRTGAVSGTATWDLSNSLGAKVAPGLYYFVVGPSSTRTVGRLIVQP